MNDAVMLCRKYVVRHKKMSDNIVHHWDWRGIVLNLFMVQTERNWLRDMDLSG